MKAKNSKKISARPDADVQRMMDRAIKDKGWSASKLINKLLRDGLIKLGYARKKDLAA